MRLFFFLWAEVRVSWKVETCKICVVFERLCCGKRSGFLIIIKCYLLSVQLAVIFNAVQLDDIHRAKQMIYDTVLQIIKKREDENSVWRTL